MISEYIVISVACVALVIIAILVMALWRNYARRKASRLINEIIQIAHYCKQSNAASSVSESEFNFNIKSEIDANFTNAVISLSDIQHFKNHYLPTYSKALICRALHEHLRLRLPDVIGVFIS